MTIVTLPFNGGQAGAENSVEEYDLQEENYLRQEDQGYIDDEDIFGEANALEDELYEYETGSTIFLDANRDQFSEESFTDIDNVQNTFDQIEYLGPPQFDEYGVELQNSGEIEHPEYDIDLQNSRETGHHEYSIELQNSGEIEGDENDSEIQNSGGMENNAYSVELQNSRENEHDEYGVELQNYGGIENTEYSVELQNYGEIEHHDYDIDMQNSDQIQYNQYGVELQNYGEMEPNEQGVELQNSGDAEHDEYGAELKNLEGAKQDIQNFSVYYNVNQMQYTPEHFAVTNDTPGVGFIPCQDNQNNINENQNPIRSSLFQAYRRRLSQLIQPERFQNQDPQVINHYPRSSSTIVSHQENEETEQMQPKFVPLRPETGPQQNFGLQYSSQDNTEIRLSQPKQKLQVQQSLQQQNLSPLKPGLGLAQNNSINLSQGKNFSSPSLPQQGAMQLNPVQTQQTIEQQDLSPLKTELGPQKSIGINPPQSLNFPSHPSAQKGAIGMNQRQNLQSPGTAQQPNIGMTQQTSQEQIHTPPKTRLGQQQNRSIDSPQGLISSLQPTTQQGAVGVTPEQNQQMSVMAQKSSVSMAQQPLVQENLSTSNIESEPHSNVNPPQGLNFPLKPPTQQGAIGVNLVQNQPKSGMRQSPNLAMAQQTLQQQNLSSPKTGTAPQPNPGSPKSGIGPHQNINTTPSQGINFPLNPPPQQSVVGMNPAQNLQRPGTVQQPYLDPPKTGPALQQYIGMNPSTGANFLLQPIAQQGAMGTSPVQQSQQRPGMVKKQDFDPPNTWPAPQQYVNMNATTGANSFTQPFAQQGTMQTSPVQNQQRPGTLLQQNLSSLKPGSEPHQNTSIHPVQGIKFPPYPSAPQQIPQMAGTMQKSNPAPLKPGNLPPQNLYMNPSQMPSGMQKSMPPKLTLPQQSPGLQQPGSPQLRPNTTVNTSQNQQGGLNPMPMPRSPGLIIQGSRNNTQTSINNQVRLGGNPGQDNPLQSRPQVNKGSNPGSPRQPMKANVPIALPPTSKIKKPMSPKAKPPALPNAPGRPSSPGSPRIPSNNFPPHVAPSSPGKGQRSNNGQPLPPGIRPSSPHSSAPRIPPTPPRSLSPQSPPRSPPYPPSPPPNFRPHSPASPQIRSQNFLPSPGSPGSRPYPQIGNSLKSLPLRGLSSPKMKCPPVIHCPIGDECYDVPPTENSISRFYCSLLVIAEVMNSIFALKGAKIGIMGFARIPHAIIILFSCMICFGPRTKMTWKIWGTVCSVSSLLHIVVVIMICIYQRNEPTTAISITLHLATGAWAAGSHFISEEVIRRYDVYIEKHCQLEYSSGSPEAMPPMQRVMHQNT